MVPGATSHSSLNNFNKVCIMIVSFLNTEQSQENYYKNVEMHEIYLQFTELIFSWDKMKHFRSRYVKTDTQRSAKCLLLELRLVKAKNCCFFNYNPVFIFYCCCIKLPHSLWLKTTPIYEFTVLHVRSPHVVKLDSLFRISLDWNQGFQEA